MHFALFFPITLSLVIRWRSAREISPNWWYYCISRCVASSLSSRISMSIDESNKFILLIVKLKFSTDGGVNCGVVHSVDTPNSNPLPSRFYSCYLVVKYYVDIGLQPSILWLWETFDDQGSSNSSIFLAFHISKYFSLSDVIEPKSTTIISSLDELLDHLKFVSLESLSIYLSSIEMVPVFFLHNHRPVNAMGDNSSNVCDDCLSDAIRENCRKWDLHECQRQVSNSRLWILSAVLYQIR